MPVIFFVLVVAIPISLSGAFAEEQTSVPKMANGSFTSPEMSSAINPALSKYMFISGSSGVTWRTVFSDESPDFKVVIVDVSFPPDQQPHSISPQSGAFVHLLDGEGEFTVAKQPMTLTRFDRKAVPPGTPIEVVNRSNHPVIIRALLVEAK
jgi:quercetin dioxygenase-like cupin family protein